MFEVENLEKEFTMEGDEPQTNNNATVERPEQAVKKTSRTIRKGTPHAEKFRKMVSEASASSDAGSDQENPTTQRRVKPDPVKMRKEATPPSAHL